MNEIVTEHQGTLTVDSALGTGTTVTVSLPMAQAAELLDPAPGG